MKPATGHLPGTRMIVIDCVNPLGFDKQGPFALDLLGGSAAPQAAALLSLSQFLVTAAFHVCAVLPADLDVRCRH